MGAGEISRILATDPCNVAVGIGIRLYLIDVRLEAVPTSAWIEAVLEDEATWFSILSIALSPDQSASISDKLISGEFSSRDISDAAKYLFGQVSGRSWWKAANIIYLSEEVWEYIGGEMALAGITLQRVSLAVWIDAAWTLIRKLAESRGKNELEELVRSVEEEPSSSYNEGSDDVEMDPAEFLKAAGELSGIIPGLR